MRAAILDSQPGSLRIGELNEPEPGPGELLLRVRACGICRTDLHILEGELTEPKLPLVPGHQIVAEVAEGGERFETGARVGASACPCPASTPTSRPRRCCVPG